MLFHLKVCILNLCYKTKIKNIVQPTVTLANYLHNNCGLSHQRKVDKADMTNQISGMRKPYRSKHDTFDVDHLVVKEPYGQFEAWFNEATNTEGIMEANAMALSTATKDGKPSVRMVLMKGIDQNGIVFYTNFLSQKATELAENPYCSVLFYWEPMKRQVRVEGCVEKVSEEESNSYFHSRPRDSQIGACVSQQSQVIASRKVIDDRNAKLQEKYIDPSLQVPKPDYWGGYRIVPNRFEFWQGQTNRLHDRIVFRKLLNGESRDPTVTQEGINGWVYERLMP